MKPLVGVLFLAFVMACAPPTPPVITPPPPALRPMAIHFCVPNAAVSLDGAGVPVLSGVTDANGNIEFLQFPAALTAFNVHGTASGIPGYGAVVQVVAGTDPLILIAGGCVQ